MMSTQEEKRTRFEKGRDLFEYLQMPLVTVQMVFSFLGKINLNQCERESLLRGFIVRRIASLRTVNKFFHVASSSFNENLDIAYLQVPSAQYPDIYTALNCIVEFKAHRKLSFRCLEIRLAVGIFRIDRTRELKLGPAFAGIRIVGSGIGRTQLLGGEIYIWRPMQGEISRPLYIKHLTCTNPGGTGASIHGGGGGFSTVFISCAFINCNRGVFTCDSAHLKLINCQVLNNVDCGISAYQYSHIHISGVFSLHDNFATNIRACGGSALVHVVGLGQKPPCIIDGGWTVYSHRSYSGNTTPLFPRLREAGAPPGIFEYAMAYVRFSP